MSIFNAIRKAGANTLDSGRPARKRRGFQPGVAGLEERLALSTMSPTQGLPMTAVSPVQTNAAPLPDIVLSKLDVQSLGNDQFKVTATLFNNGVPQVKTQGASFAGPGGVQAGVSYAGGGTLQIVKSSGGTILNSVPSSVSAIPNDPGQVIASMPIPAMAFKQSITLTTTTTGRGVFTASAVPSHKANGIPIPLPDAVLTNNSKTVDNLVAHSFTLNTATLGFVPGLNNIVQNTQIKLDSNDSFVNIPGVVNTHFAIPSFTIKKDLLIGSISATYKVKNLVSTGVSLSYEQGGLAFTVKFADNNDALHTDSSIFPNVAVDGLQVKVFLPLSYNAAHQYFVVGQTHATVTGNWHATGILGPIFNLFLPDINKKLSDGVVGLLNTKLDVLSFQVNKPIHSFVTGGHITSASVQTDQLVLNVATPH
ncbi:MAG: hypothetical protein U0794_15425 [Isosphaeraceae bacterium]